MIIASFNGRNMYIVHIFDIFYTQKPLHMVTIFNMFVLFYSFFPYKLITKYVLLY